MLESKLKGAKRLEVRMSATINLRDDDKLDLIERDIRMMIIKAVDAINKENQPDDPILSDIDFEIGYDTEGQWVWATYQGRK